MLKAKNRVKEASLGKNYILTLRPDGKHFVGGWHLGKQDGEGEYTEADGTKTKGTWKAGKMVQQ